MVLCFLGKDLFRHFERLIKLAGVLGMSWLQHRSEYPTLTLPLLLKCRIKMGKRDDVICGDPGRRGGCHEDCQAGALLVMLIRTPAEEAK